MKPPHYVRVGVCSVSTLVACHAGAADTQPYEQAPYDSRLPSLIQVALASVTPTQQVTQSPDQRLLEQTQRWYGRNRPDLAREVLNRWLLTDPKNLTALLWQGLVELKFGEVAIAQVWLKKMQAIQPQAAQTEELATAVRLADKDRSKLAELRYLARSDQLKDPQAQLLPKLQALFPKGPGRGESAIEYYTVLARIPSQRKAAVDGLTRLAQQQPEDGRYSLALAKLLSDNAATRLTALELTQQASRSPLVRTEETAGMVNRLREQIRNDAVELAAEQRKAEQTRLAALRNQQTEQQNEADRAITRAEQAVRDEKEQNRLLAEKANQQGLTLIAQGRRGDGVDLLEQAVGLDPDSPWLRYDLARQYDDMGDARTAMSVMQEGMARNPSSDMRFASALMASRQNDPAQAADYLQGIDSKDRSPSMNKLARSLDLDIALLAAKKGDNPEQRLAQAYAAAGDDPDAVIAVAQAWSTLGKARQGIKTLDQWISEHPTSGSIALLEAQKRNLLANATQTDLRALYDQKRYNEEALALSALPNELRFSPDIIREQNALTALRQGYVATAFETITKSGTSGSSDLKGQEIPIFMRYALDYERHVFMHLDRVTLDAGSVSASNLTDAADLGKVLALGLANPQGPLTQKVSGHLLAGGLETDNWRFDLGVLPGTFAVGGFLGGARYSTKFGNTDARVDFFRRPQTSSLLSFAGAKDPVTGESWGGVKRNGVNFFTYHPVGKDQSLIGDLTFALNTGDSVPSNKEINFRGSYSKTIYSSKTSDIDIGAALMLWKFDKNLRFYTFGQGGYYSPQAYRSLSIPIQWAGKAHDWAWVVRAVLGYSKTFEADTPYYPNRDDLQALAGNPIYTGGSGGGKSYGLVTQLEHTVFKHLQYGGRLQIDRSTSYAPNRLMFYLRYWLDNPVEATTPPEAVKPYSRY